MAVEITLEEESDKKVHGTRHLYRRFRYQRGATPDNGTVIITPTAGQFTDPALDAVNVKKGFFFVPWMQFVGVSVQNNSGGIRSWFSVPSLFTSLVKTLDDLPGANDGENLEALSTRNWGANISTGEENFRSYNAVAVVQGGRLYWLKVGSQDGLAADLMISLCFVGL